MAFHHIDTQPAQIGSRRRRIGVAPGNLHTATGEELRERAHARTGDPYEVNGTVIIAGKDIISHLKQSISSILAAISCAASGRARINVFSRISFRIAASVASRVTMAPSDSGVNASC